MDRRGGFFRGQGSSSSSSRPGKCRLTPAQEEERRRCVRSDGARKRAMLHYTRYGAPVPEKLLLCETEAFDRRIAEEASSSRAPLVREEGSSSRAPRTPPPPQLPEGRVVTDADYFTSADDASFERLVEVIQQQSVAEAEEDARRSRRDADIEAMFVQQGLAADRVTRRKKLEWDLERATQDNKYVDLVSDSSGVSSDYDFSDSEL